MKIFLFDSYLSAIQNSVGARSFQALWAAVDGEKRDILRGGELSCASFVSGILLWFGLIKEKHATVAGTLRDMEKSGWKEISEPRVGCILHWEKALINGSWNEHIGFFLGQRTAVSNDYHTRVPIEHHWTYGEVNGKPARKITRILWHTSLEH